MDSKFLQLNVLNNSRLKQFAAATLFASSALCSNTAMADSLDGDWCNQDNEKLTIEGSSVTTPSGQKLSGNYGRHRMTFETPAGSWRGGKSILLQQHSEESMSMFLQGGNDINGEPWTRCGVIS